MKKKLIFLFSALCFFSIFVIYKINDHLKELYLKDTTQMYYKAFKTVYDEKKELSRILYSGILEKTDLSEKLYDAKYGTLKDKEKIRSEVYQALESRYKKLKELNVKQLHIHLPDNTSFLRMHKPDLYGDDLSGYRPSVEYVNKHHIAVDTFEEGKVIHGFRFVYPVFKDKEYVGSVEVSFSAAAVTSTLMNNYYILSNFFIKHSIVESKIVDFLNTGYIQSHHKEYYYDNEVLKALKKISRKDISSLKPSKEISEKLKHMGRENKPSSLYDSNSKSIFTIIPILNSITKDNVAFLSIRSKADQIVTLNYYTYVILFLTILFFSVSIFLIYAVLSKKDQIEQERKKYETIIDLASDMIFVIDWKGNLVQHSKQVQNILKYDDKEIKKLTVFDWDKTLDKEEFLKFKNKLTDSPIKFESVYTSKEGDKLEVEISAVKIIIEGEKYISLWVRDVTQRNAKEKIYREQSKLAAMGEMIGNIAHQWRQPLSVITTSASTLMLKQELDNLDEESLISFSNTIVDQSLYLSKTIDDFKSFIENSDEYTQVKISEVVKESLNLADAIIKSNYIKVINEAVDDITINGNKNELIQALLNIISNSKDFLAEKVSDEEDRILIIKTKLRKNNTLKLDIIDSAQGIKEEIIDRIFEPYFTTKHQSVGTGLGLYTVDQIIRVRHKTLIKASNKDFEYNGKKYTGACFSIVFKGI